MENNKEYIKYAILAAKKAGKLLIKLTPTVPLSVIDRKKLMDEADRKVHDSIYETLQKTFPNQQFLSVFSKNRSFVTNGALWIIDPIVGLGNFGHGNPHYALSIALNIDNITNIGIIYNPAHDELFTCIIGQGAHLNDNLIKVSNTCNLKNALLSTRFPYDLSKENPSTLKIYHNMTLKTEGVLNHASATLDIAYVAAGRIDGFWAKGINPWDLTAAALLVKEAGGRVTTLSGSDYFTKSTEILATNGAIHNEMTKLLQDI